MSLPEIQACVNKQGLLWIIGFGSFSLLHVNIRFLSCTRQMKSGFCLLGPWPMCWALFLEQIDLSSNLHHKKLTPSASFGCMFVVKVCRNLKPNEKPLEWNRPGQQTFECFCHYVSVSGASVLYDNICCCVINGYMLVWCKQKLVWIEICLLNLSQKTSLHTICVADKLMEQIQTKWQTTRCKNIWVSLDLSMMLWWSFWLTFADRNSCNKAWNPVSDQQHNIICTENTCDESLQLICFQNFKKFQSKETKSLSNKRLPWF
jgi:hypothetical protein